MKRFVPWLVVIILIVAVGYVMSDRSKDKEPEDQPEQPIAEVPTAPPAEVPDTANQPAEPTAEDILNQAIALADSGSTAAVPLFKKVLAIAPGSNESARAALGLATLALNAGRKSQALDYFNLALEGTWP